jgi:hypothetical protein
VKRIAGITCLAAGIGLLAWMGFDYFFLAWLLWTHVFPEAGILPWVRGFGSALVSIPGGIAIGLITAGVFLKTGRSDKEAD